MKIWAALVTSVFNLVARLEPSTDGMPLKTISPH